ncbi:hypothetical protein Ahy_B10g102372 [Arachis hypogaea]|uniref:Protein FAR1-RELATED SEQUENCE n=1 Tax=Arachis hypogaea TaxID=3818 RepID=A0A444X1U3_ARAHY|nr:hypothetical protein Ahy_B10g102372 [Arachis hypogaea]
MCLEVSSSRRKSPRSIAISFLLGRGIPLHAPHFSSLRSCHCMHLTLRFLLFSMLPSALLRFRNLQKLFSAPFTSGSCYLRVLIITFDSMESTTLNDEHRNDILLIKIDRLHTKSWYLLELTNPTSEQNCKARIIVKRDKKLKYVLTFVNIQHNHAISPSMTNTLSIATAVSGYDKLTFTKNDLQNHVAKIKLDEQHRIENAFGADARSCAAYKHFGDVVSFDTMCQTNRYDMPFASFVEVNHYGQSLLYGYALLSCKEESFFIWLFDYWMRCMSSKPPIGILTDQRKAMQNSIENLLPMTQHRWKHLRALGLILSIDSIYMIIIGLYEERDKWVPIFLNNSFWAGINSIQRSKSMHAFMKGYLTSKSNL